MLLRRAQYRMADDPGRQLPAWPGTWSSGRCTTPAGASSAPAGTTASGWTAQRLADASAPAEGSCCPRSGRQTALDSLRGLEGAGATVYFGVFDQLILGEKPLFSFQSRSRRPPLDPVNALLSFAYSLLANDCASALESVGLDSYVGFLHRDRPGRVSLALDLMEELRPCMADRFVLTLINNRVVGAAGLRPSGERRRLSERRRPPEPFLKRWQERKKETLTHPYLREKLPWGLVPYVQALLLARLSAGRSGRLSALFVEVRRIMLVLITYDVNTEDAAGRKRLRQIARQCVNYGQRVQNSVFECLLDPAQCKLLQAKLLCHHGPGNGTACGFTTWATATRIRSSTSAASRPICLRSR